MTGIRLSLIASAVDAAQEKRRAQRAERIARDLVFTRGRSVGVALAAWSTTVDIVLKIDLRDSVQVVGPGLRVSMLERQWKRPGTK